MTIRLTSYSQFDVRCLEEFGRTTGDDVIEMYLHLFRVIYVPLVGHRPASFLDPLKIVFDLNVEKYLRSL